MTKSALIAIAAALLLGGTSLASAKSRAVAGAHSKPSHPAINETTARPTVADLTIACPMRTMAIPIRTTAYSTSM